MIIFSKFTKMKVSFYNLGCKVNLADISRIGKQFEELGHKIVPFEDRADIVLVNTCTVTHRADADCRNIVRRALKKSPDAFVGVLGCYAQLQPEQIAKIEGVDAVIGTKEKFEIPNLIQKFEKNKETQILVSSLEDIPFHTSAVSDNAGRTRAVLKIQDGCNYHCTFCTIPMARGESRSMEYNEIASELLKLSQSGYYEVVLSGINLGDYKNSDGKKFIDIAKLINSIDSNMRFRISSIEPNLLKLEVIEEVFSSDSKFCPHFHIPLQSGSQDILMKMKRRYKASYYADLVNNIKSQRPDCAIGVDVIVGFPGETEEKFAETMNFLNDLPVTYLHVFTYSERDNTPAIKFDGVVPHEVRKLRTAILRELSESKKNEFYQSQVGTEKIVIPETYNSDNGLWKGWTENYVQVYFPAEPNLKQIPIPIKLDSIFESKVYGTLQNSTNELKSLKEEKKFFELNVL
jgi:threonylcarbamoyladenosine tRNA methylthiotransferase MtaB